MKQETQIAEKQIDFYNKETDELVKGNFKFTLKSHKATCQRFLEFLEKEMKYLKKLKVSIFSIENKITDLQNAIKIYEEAGVK